MTHNERNLLAWLIVVVVLAMLAGCATPTAPKVLTEVKTVEIKVPVMQHCLNASEIPAKPVRVIRAGASEKSMTAGAVAELREWETYYAKADALLRSCVKQEGK